MAALLRHLGLIHDIHVGDGSTVVRLPKIFEDKFTVGHSEWRRNRCAVRNSEPYADCMLAEEMAEQTPLVTLDTSALEAARMLARHRLPGLIVTDHQSRPYSVLPASQVVRFLVPGYIQDDPSLARVLSESMADQAADSLGSRRVSEVLPPELPELCVVRHDDTVIEVAAIMARLRSPLVAVVRGGHMIGAISASRLLEFALGSH